MDHGIIIFADFPEKISPGPLLVSLNLCTDITNNHWIAMSWSVGTMAT